MVIVFAQHDDPERASFVKDGQPSQKRPALEHYAGLCWTVGPTKVAANEQFSCDDDSESVIKQIMYWHS